jgi:cell surface protein SprA
MGYISLQQRLANDEVLAVAYQLLGIKYQVGEFGNDGIDATIVTGNAPSNRLLSRKA